MGIGVDTIGFHATAAAVAGTTATVSPGDSFTVRNFTQQSGAVLTQLLRHDETAGEGFVQVKSPRLANDTTGIKVRAADSPSADLLPGYGLQSMYSGDNLTVRVSGAAGATKTTVGALQVYYNTLPGASARLKAWGTLASIIANVFTQTVGVDAATPGTWATVLSNTTADLMRADTTYALLGYTVDAAYCAVGLRCQETSTLRICGPGVTRSEVTSNWFVDMSQKLGKPFIPVCNANNRGNIHTTALSGLPTTGKVTLIWAQLTQTNV